MVNVTSPGIASVTWKHEDRQIRVYFQKDDGFIYEAAWDESTRWNSNHTQIVQAKPNTPLAAIVYMPWQPEIHIYYLDTSNVLQEYIYSTLKSSWQKGDTLPSPDLNPITTLAALTWARPTNQEIRVFYQKADDTIQELAFSSSWSVGSTLTDKAYPGTSLSATTVKKDNIRTPNPVYHVFWQAPNLSLNESIWSGTLWSSYEIKCSPPALGGITAVGWVESKSNHAQIIAFVEKEKGHLYVFGYDRLNGWIPLAILLAMTSDKNPLAAVGWIGEGQDEFRIYARALSDHSSLSITDVKRPHKLTGFACPSQSTTKLLQL